MVEFWTNPAAEPKRSHRFLVSFDLPSGVNSQIFARTFTKPQYTIGVTEHQFLDKTFYYPGRVQWNEVTLQVVNSADPDMDAELQAILLAGGYILPNQMSNASSVSNPGTVNKRASVTALGDAVRVSEIDGDGLTLGTYTLNNPFITGVAFSTLDYSTEDLLTVDVTMRYDWAIYQVMA